MPGKTNTYTLGEYGVNRVKSPVHLIDGELLAAQNATVPFDKGNRGLAKRAGMAKLNAVAAAGPILSMTWVPLGDPFGALRIYGSTNSWVISDDGISWASSATPVLDGAIISIGDEAMAVTSYKNRMWFVGATTIPAAGINALYSFDGTVVTRHAIVTIYRPCLLADAANDAIVIFGNLPFSFMSCEVYSLATGTLTTLAVGPEGADYSGCGILNGTYYQSASRAGVACPIYVWNGTAWTLEHTPASTSRPTSMAVFNGKLYASCIPNTVDASLSKILRRDSAGAWVSVLDTAGSFNKIIAHGGRLYAHRSAPGVSEVWASNDGAAWALEQDLIALGGGGQAMLSWQDALLMASTATIARRDAAGVYAVVYTGVNLRTLSHI